MNHTLHTVALPLALAMGKAHTLVFSDLITNNTSVTPCT